MDFLHHLPEPRHLPRHQSRQTGSQRRQMQVLVLVLVLEQGLELVLELELVLVRELGLAAAWSSGPAQVQST